MSYISMYKVHGLLGDRGERGEVLEMNVDVKANLERSQHSAAVIGRFHPLLEHPVHRL